MIRFLTSVVTGLRVLEAQDKGDDKLVKDFMFTLLIFYLLEYGSGVAYFLNFLWGMNVNYVFSSTSGSVFKYRVRLAGILLKFWLLLSERIFRGMYILGYSWCGSTAAEEIFKAALLWISKRFNFLFLLFCIIYLINWAFLI